jgi:hypothetical protein
VIERICIENEFAVLESERVRLEIENEEANRVLRDWSEENDKRQKRVDKLTFMRDQLRQIFQAQENELARQCSLEIKEMELKGDCERLKSSIGGHKKSQP